MTQNGGKLVNIPVMLIGRDGQLGYDFANCCPCVHVSVSDPDRGVAWPTMALIDTGADGIYVDSELVALVGSPAVRREPVFGATSTIESTIHEAHFHVENVPPIRSEFISTPLRANGRKYDVVFGRSIIALFDLRIISGTISLSVRVPDLAKL